MFDANMRYLPKGYRFFAEVHSVDEQGALFSYGLRRGDVVMCHMLNRNHKDPLVDVTINRKVFTVSGRRIKDWIVYAGNINAETDFIHDRVRDKARQELINHKRISDAKQ